MNSESNSKAQRTQSGKATSYKRVHRANRPILVTEEANEQSTMQIMAEAPVKQVAVEERPSEQQAPRRRMPGFFTSIGRGSKDAPEADARAARMARAQRGKPAAPAETEKNSKKPEKPVSRVSPAAVAAERPRPRFKMRYLWGMMIYVLIAEYLGGFVTYWMASNKLDAHLFNMGPIPVSRSTLLFLAILVIVLVVMARFDLIPRSLGGGARPTGASANAKKDAPTFETKTAQPTMRQGVQGADDDLYREYRDNQRYFQKRDRKR